MSSMSAKWSAAAGRLSGQGAGPAQFSQPGMQSKRKTAVDNGGPQHLLVGAAGHVGLLALQPDGHAQSSPRNMHRVQSGTTVQPLHFSAPAPGSADKRRRLAGSHAGEDSAGAPDRKPFGGTATPAIGPVLAARWPQGSTLVIGNRTARLDGSSQVKVSTLGLRTLLHGCAPYSGTPFRFRLVVDGVQQPDVYSAQMGVKTNNLQGYMRNTLPGGRAAMGGKYLLAMALAPPGAMPPPEPGELPGTVAKLRAKHDTGLAAMEKEVAAGGGDKGRLARLQKEAATREAATLLLASRLVYVVMETDHAYVPPGVTVTDAHVSYTGARSVSATASPMGTQMLQLPASAQRTAPTSAPASVALPHLPQPGLLPLLSFAAAMQRAEPHLQQQALQCLQKEASGGSCKVSSGTTDGADEDCRSGGASYSGGTDDCEEESAQASLCSPGHGTLGSAPLQGAPASLGCATHAVGPEAARQRLLVRAGSLHTPGARNSVPGSRMGAIAEEHTAASAAACHIPRGTSSPMQLQHMASTISPHVAHRSRITLHPTAGRQSAPGNVGGVDSGARGSNGLLCTVNSQQSGYPGQGLAGGFVGVDRQAPAWRHQAAAHNPALVHMDSMISTGVQQLQLGPGSGRHGLSTGQHMHPSTAAPGTHAREYQLPTDGRVPAAAQQLLPRFQHDFSGPLTPLGRQSFPGTMPAAPMSDPAAARQPACDEALDHVTQQARFHAARLYAMHLAIVEDMCNGVSVTGRMKELVSQGSLINDLGKQALAADGSGTGSSSLHLSQAGPSSAVAVFDGQAGVQQMLVHAPPSQAHGPSSQAKSDMRQMLQQLGAETQQDTGRGQEQVQGNEVDGSGWLVEMAGAAGSAGQTPAQQLPAAAAEAGDTVYDQLFGMGGEQGEQLGLAEQLMHQWQTDEGDDGVMSALFSDLPPQTPAFMGQQQQPPDMPMFQPVDNHVF